MIDVWDALLVLRSIVGLDERQVLGMTACGWPMEPFQSCGGCSEQRIPWRPTPSTPQDPFSGDAISVLLCRCTTFRGHDTKAKVFEYLSSFGEVDASWWHDSMNRIVRVKLDRDCTENVLNVILLLQQHDNVMRAEPHYI
jgi:hypothetical protein